MRRQIITHPRFQISFTISFVMGIVFICAFLGAINIATLDLVKNMRGLAVEQRAFIAVEMHQLIGVLVMGALFFILVFAALGVYLSYKFVGPLNRIESWLKGISAGEPFRPFTVRPGDELVGVITHLNRVLHKYFHSPDS